MHARRSDDRPIGTDQRSHVSNVQHVSGVGVVQLAGEHDLSTLSTVEHALGLIGPAEPCVVDLSAASFIESSILGVLIRTALCPEAPRLAGVVALR